MRIIIIGAGKVGSVLTSGLAREGHDVVVIDKKQDALNDIANSEDVMVVAGNGASYETMEEADALSADLVITATSSDEINILSCMLAKKMGAKNTIARVRNPEYFKQVLFLKDELGLSMAVNPEKEAAVEISSILRFPAAINIDKFAQGKAELVEFRIGEDSPLVGCVLKDMPSKFTQKVLVCVVQRGNDVFIPKGDFELKEGDRVNITASPADIYEFFKSIGILKNKIKDIMVIGGGRIVYYLAQHIRRTGIRLKIVESDEKRCRELCEAIPQAVVIHADGTMQDVLEEEGIDRMDAFLALTGNDEENIILSMYANTRNVKKIVTKINRMEYCDILGNIGLDSVISPKFITADEIIRYVRAMNDSYGSSIETLHKVANNKAEALEFVIRNDEYYTGKQIKTLSVKPNILLASIIRNGKVIIPGGNDTIEVGDSVIVVTTDHRLNEFGDIMQ